MNDITKPEDIERLVTEFYKRVRKDDLLGEIFQDVAKVDWELHLPIMILFWESLLLKTRKYTRNALQPHLDLFQSSAFTPDFMVRWLSIFNSTIDDLFEGNTATKAKSWANGIGYNIQKQVRFQESRSMPMGVIKSGL